MPEIPQQYRLDNLLSIGDVSFRNIERLAVFLIKFHAHTGTSKEIQRYGQPKFINAKIKENFSTIAKVANAANVAKVDVKLKQVLISFVRGGNNNLFLDRIRERKDLFILAHSYIKFL
jgi:aminoglycoside phosphotransferase family enzyme